VCFGTTHHPLAPPILDDPLAHLGARPGARRHVQEELRAIGDERRAEAVEYLNWLRL
jgi:hypothetical protein